MEQGGQVRRASIRGLIGATACSRSGLQPADVSRIIWETRSVPTMGGECLSLQGGRPRHCDALAALQIRPPLFYFPKGRVVIDRDTARSALRQNRPLLLFLLFQPTSSQPLFNPQPTSSQLSVNLQSTTSKQYWQSTFSQRPVNHPPTSSQPPVDLQTASSQPPVSHQTKLTSS